MKEVACGPTSFIVLHSNEIASSANIRCELTSVFHDLGLATPKLLEKK